MAKKCKNEARASIADWMDFHDPSLIIGLLGLIFTVTGYYFYIYVQTLVKPWMTWVFGILVALWFLFGTFLLTWGAYVNLKVWSPKGQLQRYALLLTWVVVGIAIIISRYYIDKLAALPPIWLYIGWFVAMVAWGLAATDLKSFGMKTLAAVLAAAIVAVGVWLIVFLPGTVTRQVWELVTVLGLLLFVFVTSFITPKMKRGKSRSNRSPSR
jgi:hypothetical protein